MKVLSDILHKAGILKEGAEAYSSGGYSVLVRNSTTQRFETVASTAFANIYTADGTLTGNRTVTSGGYSLTFTSNVQTGLLGVNRAFASNVGLYLKGSGTTSSTYNLLGTDSTGANLYTFLDDGTLCIGGVAKSGTSKLQVTNGNISILGNGNFYELNNSLGAGIKNNSGDFYIDAISATANIYLRTGSSPTERARITAAGRLLLGTTTESTYLLDVNGTARVSGAMTLASSLTFTTGGSNIVGPVGTALTISSSVVLDFTSPSFRLYTSYTSGGVSNAAFINTPQLYIGNGVPTFKPSAFLELDSTTKGFLTPRMTTAQRDAITSPATGLQVYNTTTNTNDFYNGTAWGSVGGMVIGNTITSATAGSILFAGTSGVLAQDNSNLFWDDTNNRLGIGKDTPSQPLDLLFNNPSASATGVIVKNTNSSGRSTFFIYNDNDEGGSFGAYGTAFGASAYRNNFGIGATKSLIFGSDADIGSGGTSKISFVTGGYTNSAAMTLTAAGRLLLGTTTESTYKLDVNGTARVSGDLTIRDSGSSSNVFIFSYNAGTSCGTIEASTTGIAYRNLVLNPNNSSNVGIGITPTRKLDVNGTSRYLGEIFVNDASASTTTQLLYLKNSTGNSTGAVSQLTLFRDGISGISYGSIVRFNQKAYSNPISASFTQLDITMSDGATESADTTPLSIRGTGIGINNTSPAASAMLDITSTTKGFLQPRMTTTQRDAITSPATGLQVYNTTTNTNDFYNGTAWASNAAGNIYTTDGTLAGDRIITSNGNSLTILGGKEAVADQQIGLVLQGSATTKENVGFAINNTFTGSAYYNFWVYKNGNFYIRNATDGRNAFLIQKDGNVQIGATSITGTLGNNSSLNIGGGIATTAGIKIFGNISPATGNGLELYFNTNTSYVYSFDRDTSTWRDLQFAASATTFRSNGSTSMTLTAAGRLLLGTTTESTYLLDVNGTARVSGDITLQSGSQKEILYSGQGIKIRHTLNGNGNNIILGWSGAVIDTESTTQRSIILGFNNRGNVPSSSIILSNDTNLTGYTGTQVLQVIGGGMTLNSSSDQGGTYVASSGTVGGAFAGIFASDFGNGELPPVGTAGSTIIGAGVNNQTINNPNIYLGQWGSDDGLPSFSRNVFISTTNGVGTNVEGYNLVFSSGRSTGNATSKDIIFATSTATTSGTTLQSLTQRVWIKGENGNVGINNNNPDQKLSVSGNSQITHAYTHAAGIYTSGLSSFADVTTGSSPSYTSGMFYGAFNSYYRNQFSANATIPNSAIQASQFNGTQITFVNSGTAITMTQASGIRAYANQILQFSFESVQATCSVSHVAGIQILAPYYQGANNPTISNYYGLVLNDSSEYSTTLTVTNRWAIYQDGASDNNYFKGKVVIGSTNTVGVSPLNVKNLPTSATGLASGDIWNNGGVLNIA